MAVTVQWTRGHTMQGPWHAVLVQGKRGVAVDMWSSSSPSRRARLVEERLAPLLGEGEVLHRVVRRLGRDFSSHDLMHLLMSTRALSTLLHGWVWTSETDIL